MGTPTTVDQVKALTLIGWEDRDFLPPCPGLYFVMVEGRVIYIGKSNRSLRSRWHQHPMRRVFEEEGDFAIGYVRISDSALLKQAEKDAVRAIRPTYNVHYVEGALEHSRQARQRFWERKLTGPRKQRPTPPA